MALGEKNGTDAEYHAVIRADAGADLRAVVRAELFAGLWRE